jgi:putative copper resistance protein D
MLLASLATVGHALDEPGALGIGHEANDAVHLLAGGLWLGGLVPLGMLAIEARRPEKPASLAMLQRALPRFSLAGYGAVAVIMATGLVNALLLVGSLDGLKHTPYGQLLSVKIMLFLLLLAVAVINRLIVAPRILSNNHPEGGAVVLSLTIAAEQMFGLAIIVVVSILGTLPPAMHQHVH